MNRCEPDADRAFIGRAIRLAIIASATAGAVLTLSCSVRGSSARASACGP
jgi:hypothetical protein